MSSSVLKTKLEQLSNDYYNTNNKNILFKNKQKNDCAKFISSNLDINELLLHTAYIIPNTNKIFIDYTMFKTYGTPEIFQPLIAHIKNLNIYCIKTYGNFEIHLNSDGYTVSAHERYKDFFQLFTIAHTNSEYEFSELVSNIFVYHSPSIVNMVFTFCKPFIEPVVMSKIVLYDKKQSNELIQKLLENK